MTIWPRTRPLFVGIAGGSGSGKTTLTKRVIGSFPTVSVASIQHDSYYRHRPDLSYEERVGLNYDHPDSLETNLLAEHLRRLAAGKPVEVPHYDFSTHLRLPDTTHVEDPSVVVVDGILVLAEPELRELFDLRIYIDTDADLRLARRARRDIVERGRSFESVLDQWEAFVRPMHLEFVEPAKRYADLIIPEGHNDGAVETLRRTLQQFIDGA
jgi:uridine kinase